MPYSSIADLPKAIRDKYNEHQQDVFRKAFNGAMDEYSDEGKAFAVAHAAAKRAGRKKQAVGAAEEPRTLTLQEAEDLALAAVPSPTLDKVIFEQVNGAIHFDIVAQAEGDILVFKNAILARAETNKNGDTINVTGIAELAASLAGRPIDYEHQPYELRGVFTAGRVYDEMALSTDGFIWADRYPEDAEAVRNGEYGLSIEATAQNATCSVCGGVYGNASEYCDCLRGRKKSGANRILSGLKAKGGAITRNPAATESKFSQSELYFVASHQEDFMDDFILLLAADADALFLEAISKREDVSPADKERAKKEYGDVKYADEKNKKYPIDTEAHIRAAYNYISQAKNAAKYSTSEVAAIKRKIVSAWKAKIDKEGPPSATEASADTKDVTEYPKSVQEQQKMEEEKKEKEGRGEQDMKSEEEETPEEEKKETPEEEKKEKEAGVDASEQFKARILELEQSLAAKIEELEAAKRRAIDAEAKIKDVSERAETMEARMRDAILSTRFVDEELTQMKDRTKDWRLDQIELLASTMGKTSPRRTEVAVSFDTAGLAAQTGRKKITLS